MRTWLYRFGVLLDSAAIVVVAAFLHASAHWGSTYGHRNDLGRWETYGFLPSLAAFVLAWFGRGWKRIVALVASAVLMYFWFVHGTAIQT